MYILSKAYNHSIVFGPLSIHVAGLYYHIGAVFEQLRKPESSSHIYDKVITIWRNHVSSAATHEICDEAQTAEAIQILQSIQQSRMQSTQKTILGIAEIDYLLGVLYFSISDIQRSKTFISSSLKGK